MQFSIVSAPVYNHSVRGFLFSPCSRQRLLFDYIFMMDILTVVKWYLIGVFICISLMITNDELCVSSK